MSNTDHADNAHRLRDTIIRWLDEPPEIPTDDVCSQILSLHMLIVERDSETLKKRISPDSDHGEEMLDLPWEYRAGVLASLYLNDDWPEWRELIERLSAEYAGQRAYDRMIELNRQVTHHLEHGNLPEGE